MSFRRKKAPEETTVGQYLDPEIARDRGLACRAILLLRAQCAHTKSGGAEVSGTPLASTKKPFSPKQRGVVMRVLGLKELPPLISGEHPIDVMAKNRPLKPPGRA